MQKTIVFDFDGCLADSWLVMMEVFNELAEEYGFNKISDQEVVEFKRMNTRELLKAFNIPARKALKIKSHGGRLLLERAHEIKTFDGMYDVLLSLKEEGYRLGVLTFNLQEVVDAVLDRLGWTMFDFRYSVPGFKSKTRSFKKMLKEQKINKDGMIYIGDEIRDIELAREFGVKVISVGWGYNLPEVLNEHGPDALVESPSEIKTKINDIMSS
jgi:phosphoglycolate phosphatase